MPKAFSMSSISPLLVLTKNQQLFYMDLEILYEFGYHCLMSRATQNQPYSCIYYHAVLEKSHGTKFSRFKKSKNYAACFVVFCHNFCILR
jgi:hypothetical protein